MSLKIFLKGAVKIAHGWISVHRQIQDHWLWKDKPFSKGQAWIDLIIIVNHESKKIPFDGSIVEIPRGSKMTSLQQLSERWGWSRGKISRFIKQLKDDQMLLSKRYANGTLLTVVNYGDYQDSRTANGTLTEQQRNASGTQADINNNDKQCNNNENKKSGASLELSEREKHIAELRK